MTPAKTTIGQRLRDAREHAGLLQEELARRARGAGLDWTSATVAAIETDRRELSLAEFLALRGSDATDDEVADLFQRATAARPQTARDAAQLAEGLDAEMKAARKLGVEPSQVVTASRRLWGRTLTEERDRQLDLSIGIGGLRQVVDAGRTRGVKPRPPRVGVITAARMVQARRGHITRALLTELSKALKGRKQR